MKLLPVIGFCTLACCYCHPCVKLTDGDLCGSAYTLPNNRTVYAYYGIPFAAPPIGENRFREPQPVESWIGTRNCSVRETENECVQFTFRPEKKMKGDEDCLYLNVFTPKILPANSIDLMDVIIYVHGGAFMFGTGKTISPDYIMQNDEIVFVSINYRLGILGFFSTGDSKSPGNIGLKDQVAAFKWVQKNIRQFGGDPKKVTIYGISAGAASIHYHLLSPLTTDLFQRAASASGTASLPWSLLPQTVPNSLKFARAIKCMNGDSSFVVECLRKKPIEELYEAFFLISKGKYVTNPPFGPVVELNASNAFLGEHPIKLLRNGKVKDIPWMVSVVDNEGSVPGMVILSNKTLLSSLDEKWNELAPVLFESDTSQSESLMKEDFSSSLISIKNHYFGDRKMSDSPVEKFFQMLGDRLFYTPLAKVAKLHTFSVNSNVFCYKFKYRGAESFSDYHPGKKNYGVVHGDDQFYIVSWRRKQKNELDEEMARFLSSKLTTFMKTGNPNLMSTDWKPISKSDEMRCLSIYSPTDQKMENFVNQTTMQFWESLLSNKLDKNV